MTETAPTGARMQTNQEPTGARMQTSQEPSNVIQLPFKNDPLRLNNINQTIELVTEQKKEYIDTALDFTLEHVYNVLRSMGFLLNEERVEEKDLAMLELVLESIMFRHHGFEHKLHAVTEHIISINDEDDSVEVVDREETASDDTD